MGILRDDLIRLTTPASRQDFPELMRRIVARVEVEMVFLSNNLEWTAASIMDLYRCRWQIEVFFKQIKQTLQLADFLGTSTNAVRWQIWTALLVYLLLRYLSFLSNWSHSFSRLFTLVRTALWNATSDIAVPVIVCLLQGDSERVVDMGSGCHADRGVAALRAI